MSCRYVYHYHYSNLVDAVDGCQHFTPTCPSELHSHSCPSTPTLRPPCPYFLIRFRPNLTDKLDLCSVSTRRDSCDSYLIFHLYHLCIDPITPIARHGRTGSYSVQHSATANGHSTHTSHRPTRLFLFDRRQVAHRYLRIDLGLFIKSTPSTIFEQAVRLDHDFHQRNCKRKWR